MKGSCPLPMIMMLIASLAIMAPREVVGGFRRGTKRGASTPISSLMSSSPSIPAEGVQLNPNINDKRVLMHYPSMELPSYENLILRGAYLSSVDYRTKVPSWVAEKLSLDGVNAYRQRGQFEADQLVPEMFRSSDQDFVLSRWTRGHMAAAMLHRNSETHMADTFKLSANIVPQNEQMNNGDWLRLELLSKELVKNFEDVYVVSGPLWIPHDIRQSDLKTFKADEPKATGLVREVSYKALGQTFVAAPTHFFKIIVASSRRATSPYGGGKDAEAFRRRLASMPAAALAAFIQPNSGIEEDKPITYYQVPLEAVETIAGLNFNGLVKFCASSEERAVANGRKDNGKVSRQGSFRKTSSALPQPLKSLAERRNFLKDVDLCAEDRCKDATESPFIQQSRLAAKIQNARSTDELNDLWHDEVVNKWSLQDDGVLLREKNARMDHLSQKERRLSPSDAPTPPVRATFKPKSGKGKSMRGGSR